MRHPMAKTRLASCRHEAAHWVIAKSFGVKPRKAHVPLSRGKHKGGTGYVEYGSMRKVGPVQWAVIVMAGSVAEYLWHGTPKGLASAYDFEDMMNAGIRGEDFRIVWEEAQRMVRRKKRDIWRFAKKLYSGKVVTA